MEELCRLTKTIPGLQAVISLMMLNKNLLFVNLGSQITIDFVWKLGDVSNNFDNEKDLLNQTRL